MSKDDKPLALDPRQALAVSNYRDPSSLTFGNLYQSMVKAGFGEAYCTAIYARKPKWLTESVLEDVQLVQKSERNLHTFTSMKINHDRPNHHDLEQMKVQLDASKFVLKTLGKSKYDKREEERDMNVQVNIVNYTDKDKVVDVEVDKG